MNINKKISFLSGIPSWGLAVIAFVAPIVFTIILLFSGDILKLDQRINEDVADLIFYILFDLFIASCCFFIVRQNPKSIWYVPIICNAVGIFSAIAEPNFWISSLWIVICGGWGLSIIASITGYYVGKRSVAKEVDPAGWVWSYPYDFAGNEIFLVVLSTTPSVLYLIYCLAAYRHNKIRKVNEWMFTFNNPWLLLPMLAEVVYERIVADFVYCNNGREYRRSSDARCCWWKPAAIHISIWGTVIDACADAIPKIPEERRIQDIKLIKDSPEFNSRFDDDVEKQILKRGDPGSHQASSSYLYIRLLIMPMMPARTPAAKIPPMAQASSSAPCTGNFPAFSMFTK